MTVSEDDRVRELEAKNAQLEDELRAYRGAAGTRVKGKTIVFFLFGLLALALVTAMMLWSMAKRTVASRQEAERSVRPTLTRVDAAGQAVVHGIAECAAGSASASELSANVRVKLTQAGTLGVLDTIVKPIDEELIQCIRRAPSNVHVAAGDTGAIDVEIRYAATSDPDGTHVLRTSWAVKTPGEK